MFPDEETARLYLESRLWPKGVTCPTCSGQDRITPRKAGFHRCNKCQLDFTIRTGTIFERSHIPLHKWLYAMYLLVTARKGISSMKIAKEIGVQQKSAWFMLHRLREACGGELAKLQGIVEVDEAFFGGKEANKHESKKLNAGRGSVGKVAVVGLRERGGKVIAHPVANTDKEALQGAIVEHVEVHTNGIESVWAVMKRGMHGVYHHASPKHLHRYVDEFTFRLNEGDVRRHTLDRLDSFIDAVDGKRLTYARLIQ